MRSFKNKKGEPIPKSSYNWDKYTKTFLSSKKGLNVDFWGQGVENVIVGDFAGIEVDDSCRVIITGSNCTIIGMHHCVVRTRDECNIKMGSHNVIFAGDACDIIVDNFSDIIMGAGCKTNVGMHCSVKLSSLLGMRGK